MLLNIYFLVKIKQGFFNVYDYGLNDLYYLLLILLRFYFLQN